MAWKKLIVEGKKQTWIDMTQVEIDKRQAEITQAEREEQARQTKEADRQAAITRLRLVSQNDANLADLLTVLRLSSE